jgi:glucose-1-phosphate cytidylyltransferase
MKAVILAGGTGTRLSEETGVRPKPMLEIGGRPILWHIMKLYSVHGVNDFVICCGYKGYLIKEYFANYFLHSSDATFDLQHNRSEVHQKFAEPWRVTLIDTGLSTQTGGRLKRVSSYLGDEAFCLTYGDGLADLDISAAIKFHQAEGKLATVTAIQPRERFGVLNVEGTTVRSFSEKPKGEGSWINGGFFVLSPKVLDYIEGDDTPWEWEPMDRLAREGQMNAYFHRGFWQSMDTLRDRNRLESLWQNGQAPWKLWS